MRTAYINKDNKVVYIAAFEEDKIIPDNKGKFRFGGSSYDAKTGKWKHILGLAAARTAEVSSAQDVQRSAADRTAEVSGAQDVQRLTADRTAEVSGAQDVQRLTEEVFAVDGTGLGVGDIYKPPAPAEPVVEDKNAALLAEKTHSLEELRTRIMIEKANEEAGWQDRVQKLITLRDALVIEIEGFR